MQEDWSGLPFPSPGDLLDPGIEPRSPALQADSLSSEPLGQPIRQKVLENVSQNKSESCGLWGPVLRSGEGR